MVVDFATLSAADQGMPCVGSRRQAEFTIARTRISRPTAIERMSFIVFLTMLLAISFVTGSQLDGAESVNPLKHLKESSSDGDPLKQAILMVMYAGCAILLVTHVPVRMFLLLGAPLLLLTIWSCASVGWSVNPDVSFRRTLALLGTVVLGAYGGLRFDLKDGVNLVAHAAAVVLISSLVLAVAAPALGFDSEGRLRGIVEHKNRLAAFAALSLLVFVARLSEIRHRSALATVKDGALAVIAAACLGLAQSTAEIPSLMIAFILLVTARLSRTANARLAAFIPIAISVAILASVAAIYHSGSIAEILGKNADISGRSAVWEFVAEMISRRPLQGYGYGAFWVGFDSPGSVFWKTYGFGVPHGHNGYLELALDTGAVGALLYLLALILLAVRLGWLLRFSREPFVAWAAAFLGFYLVHCMSESWLWGVNDLLTVLLIYVVVRVNLTVRKVMEEATARGIGVPASAIDLRTPLRASTVPRIE